MIQAVVLRGITLLMLDIDILIFFLGNIPPQKKNTHTLLVLLHISVSIGCCMESLRTNIHFYPAFKDVLQICLNLSGWLLKENVQSKLSSHYFYLFIYISYTVILRVINVTAA